MTVQNKYQRGFLIILAIFVAVTMMACGAKKKKPTVKMEVPDVYTDAGMQLLDKGQYEDADREFAWALKKDPKNAKAGIARGLAKAYQGDFNEALDSLKTGCKYAKRDEDKLFCQVTRIRIYTIDKRDKRWFLETKEAFTNALKINPQSSDAYFYMGFAYKDSLNFDEAGNMFKEVAAINDKHVKEAEEQSAQIQKIQRAMAGTKTGRRIALVNRISRADCAALIMEEIKLEKVLNRQLTHDEAAAAKDGRKGKTSDQVKAFTAKDISDNPLRVHIEGVLRLGVKGLGKYPDGTFRPDETVSRATFAVIMEDILEKLTGNEELEKPFQGTESPFPDVKPDHPYFEAVMVVTSRGIMEKKDAAREEFAPLAQVSGAEALSIVRKLKEDQKIF